MRKYAIMAFLDAEHLHTLFLILLLILPAIILPSLLLFLYFAFLCILIFLK